MKNVKQAADGVATLYSLGFGTDVDYGFLEKMSLENGGLARRIYLDSDSALQLQVTLCVKDLNLISRDVTRNHRGPSQDGMDPHHLMTRN